MDTNTQSKGVIHARHLLKGAIATIEQRAQASDFKTQVLADLREVERHMHRNVEKAPSKRISRRLDRDLVQSIMLACIAKPAASRKEIGDLFGVQSGRVTEILQGKHDRMLSPELREAFSRAKVNLEQMQLTLPKIRNAA
jgi:hypothetical protein